MNHYPDDTAPKHLRVGVNSAMVENAALARLMMKKGLFTQEEYIEALADVMEEEAKTYEQWLSLHLGVEVKLY